MLNSAGDSFRVVHAIGLPLWSVPTTDVHSLSVMTKRQTQRTVSLSMRITTRLKPSSCCLTRSREVPLMTLLRYRYPGRATIQDIASMYIPVVDTIVLPEVTGVVGQKYRLLVAISNKSFAATRRQLSFQIVRILETYKPELSSSAFDTPGASSSTSLTGLPPMSPAVLMPGTPNITPSHAACSSGSLTIAQQTLGNEPRTPTSKISGAQLAAASPGKSPCPSCSARRALFKTPAKKIEEPSQVLTDATADGSLIGTEEKDDLGAPPVRGALEQGRNQSSGCFSLDVQVSLFYRLFLRTILPSVLGVCASLR